MISTHQTFSLHLCCERWCRTHVLLPKKIRQEIGSSASKKVTFLEKKDWKTAIPKPKKPLRHLERKMVRSPGFLKTKAWCEVAKVPVNPKVTLILYSAVRLTWCYRNPRDGLHGLVVPRSLWASLSGVMNPATDLVVRLRLTLRWQVVLFSAYLVIMPTCGRRRDVS